MKRNDKTRLVSEKRLNLNFLGQGASDDNQGYTAGWNNDTVRKTTRSPLPDYRAPTGDGAGLFGSSHIAGVNALLADGSVRSISYSINKLTFQLVEACALLAKRGRDFRIPYGVMQA